MTIRPYTDDDLDKIKHWAEDERIHALWSAGRFPYPLEKQGFEESLNGLMKNGETPFIAVNEDNAPVGFFCYSYNTDIKEGFLKFVIVSPEYRGKDYGREMIRKAVEYAFENNAETVKLCVFSVNEAARKCYESVGFELRSVTDNAFEYKGEMWGRCVMILHTLA